MKINDCGCVGRCEHNCVSLLNEAKKMMEFANKQLEGDGIDFTAKDLLLDMRGFASLVVEHFEK